MAKKYSSVQNSPPKTTTTPNLSTNTVVETKESTTVKKHYRICTQRNEHLLAKEIELLLAEGWSLEGGATVSSVADSYGISTIFCQAVTKKYV